MSEKWQLHVAPGAANDPVFIGVGEIPTGKFPERGFIQQLSKVALLAIKDAGMVPRDIDTILLIPCLHGAVQMRGGFGRRERGGVRLNQRHE